MLPCWTGLPSGRRHYRLTLSDAIHAHEEQIRLFGGRPGILSVDAVLSAIGRPYSGYHLRIYSKGSALLESIIGNHGFVDGNKRTAVVLLFLLYERSGYELVALGAEDFDSALEDFVVGIAAGGVARAEIEAWLRPRSARFA